MISETFQSIADGYKEFFHVTIVLLFGLLSDAAKFLRLGKWQPFLTEEAKRTGRLLSKYLRSLLLHAADYRLGKLTLQSLEYLLQRLEAAADPSQTIPQGGSAASSSSPVPALHHRRLSTRTLLLQDLKNSPITGPDVDVLSNASPGRTCDESSLNEVFNVCSQELSPNRDSSYLTIQRELLVVKIRQWRAVLDALLHLRDVEKLPVYGEPSPATRTDRNSSQAMEEEKETSTPSPSSGVSPANRKRSRNSSCSDASDDGTPNNEASLTAMSHDEWPSFENSTQASAQDTDQKDILN